MSRYYGDKDSMIVEYQVEMLWDYGTIWMNGVGYRRLNNYPAYYITTDGRVISFCKETPVELSTYTNQYGHHYVDLSCEGRRYKCLVHRLVAETFISNPNNYPVVRHLDDDPNNNNVRNLAWGTQKDNHDDCIRHNRDFKKAVYCLETDTTYKSGVEAAEVFSVSKASIVHYCKNIAAPKNGYHFCYDEDKEWKLKDEEWLKPFNNHNYKAIIAISPEGKEFYYDSVKEASEYMRIPACSISNVINGHAKHTHGWRFREVNL